MRKIIKLAILPTKMTNGEWIWLTLFIKTQKTVKKYVCVSDMGWPDIGTWDWVDRWETVNKEIFNH